MDQDHVTWSDGNNPTTRKLLYASIHTKAVKHGCAPRWFDGIFGWAWHCTCEAETHFCNQQCSAVSLHSAGRLEV